MFDIGFFELTLIGVVLLVVMGPERLPEVARQVAFVVRKVRGWVYNMKAEMNLSDDPIMQELKQAKLELSDFERDLKQMGQDFAQEAEALDDTINLDGDVVEEKSVVNTLADDSASQNVVSTVEAKQPASRKQASKKKSAKKVTQKVTKKTAKKASKKTKTSSTTVDTTTAKKKVAKKVAKKTSKKVAKKKKTAAKKTTTKTNSAS